MKVRTTTFSLVAASMALAAAPMADAALARYVHVLRNQTPDTRFHLSEVEAFASSTVPDNLGGATFGGQATSTNDIAGAVAVGLGNLYPVIGTTSALEHGGGNMNPNNALERAGAVWSTANNQATESQYTLDLGSMTDVTTVRLWPRADGCCGHRWQNIEVQLLDDSFAPVAGTLNLHTAGVGNVALEFTFASTPIPEPSSLALLGLGGLALLRRRR